MPDIDIALKQVRENLTACEYYHGVHNQAGIVVVAWYRNIG